MYKIIGGDQREYGPASAEEILRWIAEGRLNRRSLVRGEKDVEWRPLSEFPEFQSALASHDAAPPPITGFTPPPANAEIWITEMLAREPHLPVGLCLSRSWELLKNNFRLLFIASLLVWAIGTVQFIPFVSLIYTVLSGVFYGGLCMVVLKRIRGEPATPGEVFAGFNIAFGQLVLVGVVLLVLTSVAAACFCVLPGIFLFVAWIFAVPLVIDKRLEFWSAMELSRKVVTKIWFPTFLLVVIALLPVILVKITAGITVGSKFGALFLETFKQGTPDPGRLMERAMRINAEAFSLSFFGRLVLLVNLPFAVAALMYAYETLFGPRTTATT